jgi:primosomal protein N' (replication factor Y)
MQKPSKKDLFCLEVAPLTSIPLTRAPFFTYLWDEAVPKGSLVAVPLFTRTLKGVVFDCYPYAEREERLKHIRFKRIEGVLERDFLTPEQLELARFVSREYFTSLGRCLVHFTPRPAKARKKEDVPKPIPSEPKRIRLTSEQKEAVEAIGRAGDRPFYLFGPASSGKTEVYMRSLDKLLKDGGQALVLVPELTLLPQEEERYGQHFGRENIAVLHSQLAPGKFFHAWEKIRSGEARVILGTRQALFAPFRKLKAVVVDEEQDDAYKQWDMSPRYDGRRVAEKLAELHGANLVFGSATPGLERFHRTLFGDIRLLTLSPLPQQPDYSIELANLCVERWNKNHSLLSRQLLFELEFALKYKRQAVLFLNRQGMSAFSICEQCKDTLRCPTCERALVYDSSEGVYRCLHCSHKSSIFSSCPKCGGMEFKNLGIGTQKVEREILKKLPSARVLRIDAQTMKQAGAQSRAYRLFAEGKADILVGTQMATKGWDLPNVALVGVIDADSLFAFPDFKTDERAFQHLVQAAGRMARIGSPFAGKAIVQTFHPENPVLEAVRTKNFDAFQKATLEQRSDLRYPPFGRLVRLVFQDQDAEKAAKEAARAYKRLAAAADGLAGVRVTPPADAFVSKVRGRHRRHIVVRLASQEIPDGLFSFLSALSGAWAIDVDPIHLV